MSATNFAIRCPDIPWISLFSYQSCWNVPFCHVSGRTSSGVCRWQRGSGHTVLSAIISAYCESNECSAYPCFSLSPTAPHPLFVWLLLAHTSFMLWTLALIKSIPLNCFYLPHSILAEKPAALTAQALSVSCRFTCFFQEMKKRSVVFFVPWTWWELWIIKAVVDGSLQGDHFRKIFKKGHCLRGRRSCLGDTVSVYVSCHFHHWLHEPE